MDTNRILLIVAVIAVVLLLAWYLVPMGEVPTPATTTPPATPPSP